MLHQRQLSLASEKPVVFLPYEKVKRVFDLAVVLIILPFILPIIGIIALLIRIDSPGPVFFKQMRTGKGGRRFGMYKFRTMVRNAEELKKKYKRLNELTWPDFYVRNDPRVTRVGKLLRKTGLDELPQIFNVLKGEMSLVGPRPTFYSVNTYSLWHSERLEATPGITGLWQVSGSKELDFDDRLRLDIEYIQRQSLLFDMEILARSIVLSVAGGEDKYFNTGNKRSDKNSGTSGSPHKPPSKTISTQKKRLFLNFLLSVAYPRKLSKGFTSPFIVALYSAGSKNEVDKAIQQQFINTDKVNYSQRTEIEPGRKIVVNLFGSDFDYSEPKTKSLAFGANIFTFIGKPKNECMPGKHSVLLSITDGEAGEEIISKAFPVEVVDFAFDHVSKPFLARSGSVILGIASFTMFLLTFIQQVDTTAGVASGSALLFLALTIFGRNHYLFSQLKRLQNLE